MPKPFSLTTPTALTSYAQYRLPYSDHYTTLRLRGAACVIDTLASLEGRQGFVIAPFQAGPDTPIVLLPASDGQVEECSLPSSEAQPGGRESQPAAPAPSAAYAAAFHRFSQAVRSGQFSKLVLSRSLTADSPTPYSPQTLFLRTCQAFPRAMVMLFSTPQTGTWLVASPEILLDFQPPYFRTMALAGTMPHREGLPAWSTKNQEEQHIVEQYIADTLKPYADTLIKDGLRTVQAGPLMHLRTDFRFTLRPGCSVARLLCDLHPTPAVCGLPKEEALRFILQNEQAPRRYYSGFAGPLGLRGETHLYVMLRCLQLTGARQAVLHAGGGIMPDSILEEEWQETQQKMIAHVLR